jgi:hypothetical protein
MSAPLSDRVDALGVQALGELVTVQPGLRGDLNGVSARAFFTTLTGPRRKRRQGLPLPFLAALRLSAARRAAFRFRT